MNTIISYSLLLLYHLQVFPAACLPITSAVEAAGYIIPTTPQQSMMNNLSSESATPNEEKEAGTNIICASCGKEGDGDNMNTCNKCDLVKYCNAACKKKHKSKHKKECERLVAELHDEALFVEPPPERGDCPICFIRLPTMASGRRYYECCGKTICRGCCHADVYDNHGNIIAENKCPFCRTPEAASVAEDIERLKKRMEVGDAYAFLMIGSAYTHGSYGLPQDSAKAMELYHRAAKFGYNNIGYSYACGWGVERDEKMATYYYELAAMEGFSTARHNLGDREYDAGNYDRALKHHMIAVRGGDTDSVKEIQRMYKDGHATKVHYANALQSYQVYLDEIKSDQRDKAAALGDGCGYY